MITVMLPDGRSVNVNTDNQEIARKTAKTFLDKNPISTAELGAERGAQLGKEDISATGDVLRGVGAGLVSAAEGISTLPFELAGSEEDAQQIRDFFAKYKPETSTELGKAARFIAQFAAHGS